MDIDLSVLRMMEREREIPFEEWSRSSSKPFSRRISSTRIAGPSRARASNSTARPATSTSTCPRSTTTVSSSGSGRQPRRLRPHRRLRGEAGHQPALARHRRRQGPRRIPQPRGRHRRRRHPAGTQPADDPHRPRERRGDPAAGGAGARRGVHARFAHPRLRDERCEGAQGAVDHRQPHPPGSRAQAVRPRGSRDRLRSGRDREPRARSGSPVEDRGPCDPAGHQREGRVHRGAGGARARRHLGAPRREDRHRRLVGRPSRPSSRNALSPAKVSSAFVVDASAKAVRALVPDYQLSLAIGKEGQNARLAAKLTGARIDIQPDSVMES